MARDISMNVSSTKNVRDLESFAQIPNARISGSDERDAGWVAKADLEYRRHALKWTNTFEGEFSESKIYPVDQPVVPASESIAPGIGSSRRCGICLARRRSSMDSLTLSNGRRSRSPS